MTIPGFFQILSRNNDQYGNPYRLAAIYDESATICKLVEERCSRPNIISHLVQEGFVQLPDVHLTNGEYKTWIVGFRHLLEHN